MSDHVRPWYACTGAPCTCPKPVSDAVNGRRLAWFTDDELRAELRRRGVAADDGQPMAYGFGPWTDELRQRCACGHPRGDHFRHDGQCLHSTEAETWACDCAEYRKEDAR